MAVFGGLWDAVLVIFLVLVFAEYIKIRAKVDKPFKWIGAAGLWFLLAASFDIFSSISFASWGSFLLQLLGWLFLLIGSVWAVTELIK